MGPGSAIVWGAVALRRAPLFCPRLSLVSYAWGFGAAFGPVILLSLFWRGKTRNGGVGLLVGAVTESPGSRSPTGIFDMVEVLPGFALSLLAVLLVSRMSEGRRERECFETPMITWRRPQDAIREPTAAKAQGASHEQ